MNRSLKESLTAGRNGLPHRRGFTLTASKDADEKIELFSRNRPSLPVASSSDESDLSAKLERLSVGSEKPRNGLDDLLASTDGGKHDYDWGGNGGGGTGRRNGRGNQVAKLLTPPGTPDFPSSNRKESQPTPAAPKSSSLARSVSTTKSSRLSVSQSESNHSSRPARSSSVTRTSISTTQYSSYSNKTNILNTSSTSVSSYIRPSTPTNRSSSTARSSTPSTRSTPSRSSTPSRTRPSPTSSNTLEKPRPLTRPSTPNSRAQIPANLSSPPIRSISRPSTPTRRNTAPSLTPSTGSSASNGRNGAPSLSRPSSPGPRVRPPPQPIVLPDFPHDTPPNLRTTLPNRPLSAGRSRPGAVVTTKGNVESTSPATVTRRPSSPIVNRGRLIEPPVRVRPLSNGHVVDTLETRKSSHASELSQRKAARPSTSDSGTGFGRSISKNSLNMAIRHMDIRNGGSRPLTGSAIFPQSIRAANNSKSQPGRASSVDGNYSVSSNGFIPDNGSHINGSPRNGAIEDKYITSSKLTNVDIYESSRYDAMLFKEDMKNTSWLHSVDDNSDQGSLFDNGFESLPEPFGPL